MDELATIRYDDEQLLHLRVLEDFLSDNLDLVQTYEADASGNASNSTGRLITNAPALYNGENELSNDVKNRASIDKVGPSITISTANQKFVVESTSMHAYTNTFGTSRTASEPSIVHSPTTNDHQYSRLRQLLTKGPQSYEVMNYFVPPLSSKQWMVSQSNQKFNYSNHQSVQQWPLSSSTNVNYTTPPVQHSSSESYNLGCKSQCGSLDGHYLNDNTLPYLLPDDVQTHPLVTTRSDEQQFQGTLESCDSIFQTSQFLEAQANASRSNINRPTHNATKEPIKYDKLRNYRSYHTGKKQCQCDVCNICFYYESALKIHSRRHLNEKLFQGYTYDGSFYNESKCSRHCRMRTGGKSFRCYICGKSFRCKIHLKKHYSGVHTNEKLPMQYMWQKY